MFPYRHLPSVAIITSLLAAPLEAQQHTTTAPSAHGAEESGLVAPASYLSFPVGADFRLAGWDSITGYLALLAETSPSLRVDTLGLSTQGRPFILVTATSPDNMQRLEEIRATQARLADPRRLPPEELESLLETQPAVVLIAHNIHSTEIASSQGVMELAYQLASDPDLANVLEDVVVLLVPSVNPDGQRMVVDWYGRTLGTPFEGSGMPWLYHPYVGHDNNRDFFMLTQVESQLLNDVLYTSWFPEVVYDVHQMGNRGARMFAPPFDDPANPNLDPLIVRSISLFGLQISTDLEAAGKAGVVNADRFDLWWHGGLRTAPARHNMIGLLTESASVRIASPIFQEPAEVDRQPESGVAYPNPWPGGWWRLRDIIDYQLIAARSVVRLAARQRPQLIRNYVELGRRAIRAGTEEPPFAYIVPADQRDPGSAAEMLRVLQHGGIEIHTATSAFRADGLDYGHGDWVVLMAQPYRAHAKDLLEPQRYPDRRLYPGGPPDAPYDASGWTLPLQMGVEAIPVKARFEAQLEPVAGEIQPPAGRVSGSGPAFILENRTNAANLAIHRTLAGGGEAVFLSQATPSDTTLWPAGSVVLKGQGVRDLLNDLAQTHGLSATAFSGTMTGDRLARLRLGLYQPWTASMDEGWTRWVFEGWELPYQTIHDAELRTGGLADRYDVIVLPDVSARSLLEGRAVGTVPPEYTGGIGEAGVAALRSFVKGGGTLICLDSSSEFAIEHFDLPVDDLRPEPEERSGGDTFYAPGSLLAVTVDPDHPLGYGMPLETVVYYSNSPIFQVREGAEGVTAVARYVENGQLLSGWAINTDFLAKKAALVAARHGSGMIILFGFRPQHRAQTHETFKILFNAIYWGAAQPTASGAT